MNKTQHRHQPPAEGDVELRTSKNKHMTDYKIEHDKDYQQFSIALGEDDAELAYATPDDQVIDFTHTYVPEDARGKGIANQLIREGLKYAEEHGLKVIASCTAVKSFMESHQEYNHLLKQ